MSTVYRQKIRDLAKESQADPEETLIRLWDAGFTSVVDIDSDLTGVSLKKARRILAIPTQRELQNPEYWKERLNITDKQFEEVLLNYGITLSPKARKLPEGAIRKLKNEAKSRAYVSPTLRPKEGHTEVRKKERKPCPPLEWLTIGHRRHVSLISEEEVLAIHKALVEDFARQTDPIEPSGPRPGSSLASALFRPQTSSGNVSKYPTVEMSAASLLHSMILNHPFHNGNKRTALVTMLVFLDRNGFITTSDEDELFKLVLRIAQHDIVEMSCSDLADREVLEIARWISSNTRLINREEHPLPFHRLRRILSDYGCKFGHGSSGSKINITRQIEKTSYFFRIKSSENLQTQIYYGGEGREVDRNTINKVRVNLQLDEEHGIDSMTFYGDESPVSDFINRYRKTLKRLSKL